MRRWWVRVRDAARDHGEHVLFGLALVTLLVLGLWWTRLLSETIEQADAARAELLRDAPPEVRAELAAERDRRRLMITGEGTLLMSLLGVLTFMLYRLVTSRTAVQREMSLFVGQMTHEMKTPLAGLRALLETIERGRVPPEQLPELAALGLEQIDREEHLVQTLLQAQRLRLAREPLQSQALPLPDLLERFRAHRAPGSATLRVEGATGVGLGDPDAVWTILENLVDNAVKFEARTVRLRAWDDARHAFVACEDDGIGFPPERASELFHAYRSVHEGASRHGTGLGLFLCRRLARAMGGDLAGTSPGEGQGARFVLTLPREAT